MLMAPGLLPGTWGVHKRRQPVWGSRPLASIGGLPYYGWKNQRLGLKVLLLKIPLQIFQCAIRFALSRFICVTRFPPLPITPQIILINANDIKALLNVAIHSRIGIVIAKLKTGGGGHEKILN
jgi:hypothetical protein